MNLISLIYKFPSNQYKATALLLSLTTVLVSSGLLANSTALKDLPGWQTDSLIDSWAGWQASCTAFRKKKLAVWIKLCDKSKDIQSNDPNAIRTFFESEFKAVPIVNNNGSTDGIITGYFEPVLSGRLETNEEYRFPIYSKPQSQELQTLTRREIELKPQQFQNNIIAWTNDPYDLFFLHIQGSGRINLKDNARKSLVYAGNNGHTYTSIGKVLIDQGLMEKEKISMQTLKQWLIENPKKAKDIMHQNERFIFFNLQPTPADEAGPRGSLNVPLTPQRSIAIDPSKVTMGSPVWLDTTLPDENDKVLFRRLVFAQDTGAAIKGNVRADVFFGQGDQAEFLAGNMNQNGKMYLLVPH